MSDSEETAPVVSQEKTQDEEPKNTVTAEDTNSNDGAPNETEHDAKVDDTTAAPSGGENDGHENGQTEMTEADDTTVTPPGGENNEEENTANDNNGDPENENTGNEVEEEDNAQQEGEVTATPDLVLKGDIDQATEEIQDGGDEAVLPTEENTEENKNTENLNEPSTLVPQNTTETGQESRASAEGEGTEEIPVEKIPTPPEIQVIAADSESFSPPPAQRDTFSRASTSERTKSAESEVNLTNTALNLVWSFGLNRNVAVLNLSDGQRRLIMYCCAHTGIIYNFETNKQQLLQGHSNAITCSCVSEDKKWLATGDKGEGSMVIIWDTHTNTPVQTIFDPAANGVVCVAMTADARYLATLSAGLVQTLSIWDWTVDGDSPICSAELKPSYGLQNFIHFNPEDIHFIVTNSDSQVIFYNWEHGKIDYFAPPLNDQDFNKAVGRYSQSIFQRNSSRALTATSLGNLVVWDTNKPITKLVNSLPSADKKALKIIRLQERGIDVLTTTDRFIVVGDTAGHVKFFDQTLKLVNWYQDFHLGPVSSISFEYINQFSQIAHESSQYPPDATIDGRQFVIRNFVIGTHSAVYGHITAEGTKVQVIHKEHDAATHALASHPREPWIAVGGYSGLLKVWNYSKKTTIACRQFEKGNHIYSCAYDPKGSYLALGFANGAVRILEALTLDEESEEVFRYAKDTVTHIVFSHDSQYLATADAEYTVTVYRRDLYADVCPYKYLGRYRAHYKLIKDIMFGVQLDSNYPRLLSLGEDRVLVEYDLENSKDGLKILSSDRIEQSAVPTCMEWYPPITKENFIITANDQLKFKLYNATTKMCRKTLLGPTYGSPLKKLCVIPTKDEINDKRYLAYITKDKVGLQIFPLDGNPHNSMALIAHPSGVANLAVSHDGRYLFTVGGVDSSLHMWYININALEAQANLGGSNLVPFYGLLDGGRDGELFAELEDYFYYAQIRNQGVNTMDSREVNVRIPLSEVPYVMRAMGFYPSEQEIDDMLNEMKFSQYVESGQFVEDIELGDFIKLYINHRPAFGLSTEKLIWAFEKLGLPSEYGSAIDRGDLLDLLQTKGEHMTEVELAEYLTTLMGFNEEGGTSEQQSFDPTLAGDLLDNHLPLQVNADMFAKEILGFSMYEDNPAVS